MANMEQVQIVRQGRDAVARWREEHPGENFDLNASYMSHARIPQVDLSGSDIRDSDFMGAMLRRSNLSGCFMNSVHMYRANLREANLSDVLMNGANLRGADLRDANLENANLDRSIFSDADLTGANLSGANLSRCNLDRTNLTNCNLTGVNFNGAALTRTNLTNANVQDSDFYEAILNTVNLSGAQFAGSILGYTVFQNCDLSSAQGLDQIRHDAPSSLGMDSMLRSAGKLPDDFILGVGLPQSLLEFQKSLAQAPALSGDYFISCADADVPFARQLQTNLRASGIRCWLFPENARGSALVDRRSSSQEEEVERWVRHYDKLLLVCSAVGFASETLRNDITAAKERQTSGDEWVLFLVDKDGCMVAPRDRYIRGLSFEIKSFDLQGQESNTAEYQQTLQQLSEDLRQVHPAKACLPAVDNSL